MAFTTSFKLESYEKVAYFSKNNLSAIKIDTNNTYSLYKNINSIVDLKNTCLFFLSIS